MKWGTPSQQGSWPKATLLIAALVGSQTWETPGSISRFPRDPWVCQELCFWDPISHMGIWLQEAAGKAWLLRGSSRGSNHGKTFPNRALVYAFLASSPCYAEVICTMCPPETPSSFWFASIAYARQEDMSPCSTGMCWPSGLGVLVVMPSMGRRPWCCQCESVTKTSAQGLLFPAAYTLSRWQLWTYFVVLNQPSENLLSSM